MINATTVHPTRSARAAVWTEAASLAGFCAYLFFFGLGSFGLVGADEPRYAQVAREMLARHDWITPTINGVPWLEKPVLYYWGAMLSYSLFGVSDWAARVPSAVAASAMVVAAYLFMRRLRPGSQLDAALIAASSAGVIGFARAASTDMSLTATFVMGMLAWYTWRDSERRIWLATFYVLMALGTLAKGPVAPALAALIIVVFALARREVRLVARTLWWPGIAAFLVVSLPWYLAVQAKTGTFFRVFLLEHNLERFGSNLFQHRQPFWYYLPVLVLGVMPWTVMLLRAFFPAARAAGEMASNGTAEAVPLRKVEEHYPAAEAARDFRIFLLAWAAVPLVFFTFSQSKLPGYILPAIVPLTILVAERLHRTGERPTESPPSAAKAAVRLALDGTAKAVPLRGTESLAIVLLHAAAAGGLLAGVLLAPSFLVHVQPSGMAIALAAGAGLLVAVGIAATVRMQGLRTLRFVTLVPVVLGVAFIVRIAAPTVDATQSARPVAQAINRLEMRQTPIAVFQVRREVEYGLNFYLNRQIQRYERGEIPAADHLVLAKTGAEAELQKALGARRLSHLPGYAAQGLEFYWVSGPMEHHMH